MNSEDEGINVLFDEFVELFYSDYLTGVSVDKLRLKITKGFRQLIENCNSEQSMEVPNDQEKVKLLRQK